MLVTRTEVFNLLRRIHLFKPLGDSALLQLVKKFEVVSYEEGQIIFEANALATSFFIIYNGVISVELETNEGVETLSLLQPDDYFGEDVLDTESYRHSIARACKSSVVLKISSDDLIEVIEDYSDLASTFKVIQTSYQNLLKIPAPWCKAEESIYYFNRAHPLFLMKSLIFPILVIIFSLILGIFLFFQTAVDSTIIYVLGGSGLLIGMGWAVWNIVDWLNSYCIITDQRAILIEKVVMLYESRQETPLGAVLSITEQTNLAGRSLSYGNIDIRTYTGVLHFKHLAFPEQVIALFEEHWERAKKRFSEEDRNEMEKLLRERFSQNDEDKLEEIDKKLDLSEKSRQKNNRILSFLANIFSLRTETDDIITYHTHWFILLKMIILPTLILLILTIIIIIFFNGSLSFLPINFFFPTVFVIDLISIVWWLYRFVDWRNDYYLITKDQIVDVYRKPLGLEDRQAAPIKNIQSIEFKRLGIIGIFLNFGTVFIRVGDKQFMFDHVFNPAEIQRELFERYMSLIKSEKSAQTDRDRQRMADWIDAYHHIIKEKDGNSNENENEDKLE